MRRALAAEIREEIVKRFEEVVTKEIRSHNIAIRKYHNDLVSIQDTIKHYRVEQEVLKQESSKSYLISQTNMYAETKRLEDGFENQRKHISSSRDLLESKILEFEDCLVDSVSSEQFLEFKKEINDRFDAFDRKIEVGNGYIKDKLYDLNIEIFEHLEKSEKINKKLSDSFERSLLKLSEDLATYKIDAQGLKKEIVVFRKDIMVMERKIEHLYMLIDELNKKLGGDL